MKIAVFHGSPRKGNTYKATEIFMNELSAFADVQYTEFFLPEAMPQFCTGCQLCLGGPHEKCPHSQYVTPILNAILNTDALIFTTPHYGACSMSSCMKNLLDHLDFLTLNVTPRKELFNKKAFIITTGAGSTAAIKPIKKYLRNWGVNRVYSLGFRMFIDKWAKMSEAKQIKFEKMIRQAARKFYSSQRSTPYISTVFMYYMSKFIIKRYIGEDGYPYQYWNENGYFNKRPF
jgi:multimeric flavodoxin WrbA